MRFRIIVATVMLGLMLPSISLLSYAQDSTAQQQPVVVDVVSDSHSTSEEVGFFSRIINAISAVASDIMASIRSVMSSVSFGFVTAPPASEPPQVGRTDTTITDTPTTDMLPRVPSSDNVSFGSVGSVTAPPTAITPNLERQQAQEIRPLEAVAPLPVPAPSVSSSDVMNYAKVDAAPPVISGTVEAAPHRVTEVGTAGRVIEAQVAEPLAAAAPQTSSQSLSQPTSTTQTQNLPSSTVDGRTAEPILDRVPVDQNLRAAPSTQADRSAQPVISSTPTTTISLRPITSETAQSTTRPVEQVSSSRQITTDRERLAVAERTTQPINNEERRTLDVTRQQVATTTSLTDAERLALAERARSEFMQTEATFDRTAQQTDAERLAAEVVSRAAAAAAVQRYTDGAVNPDSWIRNTLVEVEAGSFARDSFGAGSAAVKEAEAMLENVEYVAKVDHTLGLVQGEGIVAKIPDSKLAFADQAAPEINAKKENADLKVGNPVCQSTIFDCEKLSVHLGKQDPNKDQKEKKNNTNDFHISVITMGKHDQLLWVMGNDFFAPIDPMTRVGMACKGEAILLSFGKTKEGFTNAVAFEKDNKIKAMSGETLKKFKKIISLHGKPIAELIKSETIDCDFEKYLIEVGIADSELYALPGSGLTERVESVVPYDDKLILLYRDMKDNKDGSGGSKLEGISVLTVGDSAETSSVKSWVLPAPYQLKKTVSDFVANVADDGQVKVDFNIPLGVNGATIVSCKLNSDNPNADCTSQDVNDSKDVVKDTISKKIVVKSKQDLKNESFGMKLVQKLTQDNKVSEVTVHKFEGFAKIPDAVVVNEVGNRFIRLQDDGTVVEDAAEFYPGAIKCVVADVDNYGGPDQFCLVDNGLYFFPKLNLPPQIDVIDTVDAASKETSQLNPVVQTQEGEDLTYQWTLAQIVDGKEVDRTAYFDNSTSEKPMIKWPSAMVPADAQGLAINENAPMAKSMGAKSAAGSVEEVYLARLVVTDPAGATDAATVNLSRTVNGIAVKGFGTDLVDSGKTGDVGSGTAVETPADSSGPDASIGGAARASGIFGGCTLIRQ